MEAKATDYSNVVDITGDGERVSREELFARQYIQDIDPFPELQVRLTRIFGPGPERDMLHQLIYWFGKKKMQNRWTLYKTFDEWRDERGLNRKQVDKARQRLKPTGIVVEIYGPYKRVHYRIDWLRLREVLDSGRLYPLKGGQSMTVPPKGGSVESDTPKGESITTVPPKGESVATVPPQMDDTPLGNGENPLVEGGQSNTGTYAGKYVKNPHSRVLSGNSLLQSGENGLKSRPSPPPKHKDFSQKQEHHEGENGSRQASFGSQPDLDAELLSEIRTELTKSHNESTAAEAFSDYEMFDLDSVYVMEAVARCLGLRLTEDLRAHVRTVMRELEADGSRS